MPTAYPLKVVETSLDGKGIKVRQGKWIQLLKSKVIT